MIDHHFIKIYEEDYAWLPVFFEELGFSRKNNYMYKDLLLTDTFVHEAKKLAMTLTLEFSPRRRTWDVIGLWLMSIENTSVNKHWSVWRSELNEEQLKESIQLAVDAFSMIHASYADYDDNEPLYLGNYGDTIPLLRGEEYYIAENERWIHSKDLGQLYIDAFKSGFIRLYDIRPVKIAAGQWDGYDKEGHRTGGIVWEEHYGGFLSDVPPFKIIESDELWYAKQELKERVKENDPEIFPKEDVELCVGNELEPYPNHLSCPFCGKSSEQLRWIHFCSPPRTWRDMCGREGALSICVDCGWQIEFICEVLN